MLSPVASQFTGPGAPRGARTVDTEATVTADVEITVTPSAVVDPDLAGVLGARVHRGLNIVAVATHLDLLPVWMALYHYRLVQSIERCHRF